MPLRNLAPVIDTVPGASAIQALLDQTEWAQAGREPPRRTRHLSTRR